MIKLLCELCALDGTSGAEETVRKRICSELDIMGVSYRIDALGNVIGSRSGKRGGKKLMLAAHMDEVGMMITHINPDGTLGFGTVGGISAESLIAKQIRINGHSGVIGSRAVHNLSAAEKNSLPDISSLYIDIGALNEDEAKEFAKPGDCAFFDSDAVDFGDDMLIGKAIDDRAGCAVLLKLIGSECEYGFDFVFTVQEEVGARGAAVAAFSVNPDFAIVIEATTAADIPSVSGGKRVCPLGGGAAIAFMDRSTVYDRELFSLAQKISNEKSIPCQIKSLIAGGNDCGSIHKSSGGVRCIAVSVPCRYLHSPVCVAAKSDVMSVYSLVLALVGEISELKG